MKLSELLIKKFVKNYENTEDLAVRTAYGKLAGFVGIVCNVVLFIAKLLIGVISGAVSITADAVNNLSDAASSIISLLGFKLAEKPADAEHPYGHGRYEYLSALSVAVLILVIGIELLKSGIEKIINPTKVDFSIALVLVLIISVLVKLWMMLFNKKSGKKINSQALLATSQDCRNDVISTLAVLCASVISHLTSFELDGYIGVIVAVFILTSGFGLIKETIDPMLGRAPDAELVNKIKDKIMSYEGVLGIHDLIVHDYGPSRQFASVHIEMAAEEDVIKSHDTIDNIESDFRNNDNISLIIHYDPVITSDSQTDELKALTIECVKRIDDRLTIHDFRIVPGTTHTNLVFDCVAPFELQLSDYALCVLIDEEVKKENQTYNCVILIDRSSLI